MSKLPKISVITPIKNGAKTFEKAIKSLIDQKYPNVEYFVMDGASTDGTLDIIKKYQDYIFFYQSQKDESGIVPQVEAYKKASGDLIILLNADDYFEPGIFFKVAEEYNKNPNFDIYSTRYRVLDADLNIIEEISKDEMEVSKDIFFQAPAPNSRFFSRKIFEKYGYQNIRDNQNRPFISNDVEFLARIILQGATNKVIDAIGYNYIAHEGSLTFSSDIKTLKRLCEDKIYIADIFLKNKEITISPTYKKIFKKWLKKYRAKLIKCNFKERDFSKLKNNICLGMKDCGFFGFLFYLLKSLIRK